ncbi:hypothetical protein TYRP_003853 [Tyrophagus putrescentiae]|nr:hypothetical protein TYRP_003853 [Tyrophagus putrescentiae]
MISSRLVAVVRSQSLKCGGGGGGGGGSSRVDAHNHNDDNEQAFEQGGSSSSFSSKGQNTSTFVTFDPLIAAFYSLPHSSLAKMFSFWR